MKTTSHACLHSLAKEVGGIFAAGCQDLNLFTPSGYQLALRRLACWDQDLRREVAALEPEEKIELKRLVLSRMSDINGGSSPSPNTPFLLPRRWKGRGWSSRNLPHLFKSEISNLKSQIPLPLPGAWLYPFCIRLSLACAAGVLVHEIWLRF